MMEIPQVLDCLCEAELDILRKSLLGNKPIVPAPEGGQPISMSTERLRVLAAYGVLVQSNDRFSLTRESAAALIKMDSEKLKLQCNPEYA